MEISIFVSARYDTENPTERTISVNSCLQFVCKSDPADNRNAKPNSQTSFPRGTSSHLLSKNYIFDIAHPHPE